MSRIEQELGRGWKIHQQQHYQDAEQIYRNVLRQAPGNPNAWCYLGIALHDQRRYAEAVESYRRALELQPEFPIALNNLGNSLRYVAEFEESDRCFERALQLKPDYLNALKNRGTLQVWAGNLDKGLSYYQQALKINPSEAELHRNLGVIYLLQGRFEEGWSEYRWRWRVGDLHRPFADIPIWDGDKLEGQSVVLTAEQGLGDTVNFVRFARILQQQGANTIVYCQPQLMALLQSSQRYVGNVYPNNLPLQRQVDYQCSLLDVADVLRIQEASIPGDVPYLLPAENLLMYWRQKLNERPRRFRVGIAWQGNPEHQADAFRSIPLRFFEGLAGIESVELISLQSGFGEQQMQNWQGQQPLHSLGQGVDKSSGAFMDTAAIMQSLDLVITSDTAIAHVAGSMCVPTWIALGYIPDWRWLLQREDSPWYPTVKLFRQSTMGEWSSVFKNICEQLGLLVKQWTVNKDLHAHGE